MSSENKKYSGYSADVKARFLELGRRLFLVDYSKPSAAKTLRDLAGGGEYSSFLLLAETPDVARAYANVLSPSLGEMHVVDSVSEIEKMLGDINRQVIALSDFAPSLKTKYKNLIVSRTDVYGADVFGRRLCADITKAGCFLAEYSGSFTFLDLLGEAGYEFVAVDGVYDILEFLPEGGEYKNGEYDRIDFLGKNYFSHYTRSFSKLCRVTSRASACVAISDVVAVSEAVELYAVLELLFSKQSMLKTREALKPIVKSFSMDGLYGYDGACESIYNAISYGRDADSILSGVLQRTKGCKQRVPGDISAMRDYLTVAIDYMSVEDLFLSLMNAEIRDGKYPAVESVLENMNWNSDDLAMCFAKMFFSNEMKGEYESSISVPYLYDMTKEELTRVYALFEKYGVYHYLDVVPDRVRMVRIKRDNSGFEYFARRYAKCDVEDSLCYSVLGDGTDDVFKCVALERLADGRDSALGFKFPAIIVSSTPTATENIKAAFKGCSYSEKICDLSGGSNSYTIVDYATFRRMPDDVKLGSVVFYDFDADIVKTKLMVAKALSLTSGAVVLLTTYGDLGGTLADNWQAVIEHEEPVVPFEISEINIKTGAAEKYPDVVARINGIYKMLYSTVTLGSPANVKSLPEIINQLVIDLGNSATFVPELAALDIEYAARMGESYNAVFENTASVGSSGESICVYPREYIAPTKGGKAEDAREASTYAGAFFNVCTAMLRHDCDYRSKNCADCAEYKKFVTNEYAVLKRSLGEFFTLADKYAKAISKLRYEIELDDIIFSEHEEDNKDLTKEEVEGYATAVTKALEVLEAYASKSERFFHTEYNEVLAIREAVYQIYRKVLRKYYKAMMIIFSNSTDLAKQVLDGAREAISAHLEA